MEELALIENSSQYHECLPLHRNAGAAVDVYWRKNPGVS